MRVVLQKVKNAQVKVEDQIVGTIDQGHVVLLGIEDADTEEDIDWLIKKVAQMRIFADDEGKMNLSLEDVKGDLLIVSQFTLHAKYKKGNRPSFVHAAAPDYAEKMYDLFIAKAKARLEGKVATGRFGAMMEVNIVNDGPITITMDTKNKE